MEVSVSTPEEIEAEFLPSFQGGFKAPFLGPIYKWASEYVTLPNAYNPPGRFSVDLSRYLTGPFDALKDPTIRQVNVMAPPRSGKTLLGEIFLLHSIANNPSNVLWLQSSDEQMKKLGGLRMTPLLTMCPPVNTLIDHSDRFSITQKKYKFANKTEVHLGSAKIRDLQGVGYRFIIFDEVWLASPGFIAEAQARVGDYPDTYKILLLSQGGSLENADWHIEFHRAPIYEWAYPCPKCHRNQVLAFNFRKEDKSYGGLIWDRNEKTCPSNVWDPEEASKTAVLKCLYSDCDGSLTDTPENREYINANGLYVCTKKEGDTRKRSYRWNALADKKVSFATICKEWLEASNLTQYENNDTLKQIFTQKRLAKSWGIDRTVSVIDISATEYDSSKEWAEELDLVGVRPVRSGSYQDIATTESE